MFVAASTRCFSDLSLDAALQRLVDLEYTSVEIMIHESEGHLKPSEVMADLDAAVRTCRQTHRLTPVAFSIGIDLPDSDPTYYDQFAACCKLAKASKVVTLTVPSAELGTPYNAEVERLRKLVAIASLAGVRVGMLTEGGRMTQDPATAVVLCDSVKGLGLTLDPSHYICGPHHGDNYDQVFSHVYHVRLRDTSKDQLQVRIGQGLIEYGKLISQLARVRYDRALSVDMAADGRRRPVRRDAEDAAAAGKPLVAGKIHRGMVVEQASRLLSRQAPASALLLRHSGRRPSVSSSERASPGTRDATHSFLRPNGPTVRPPWEFLGRQLEGS